MSGSRTTLRPGYDIPPIIVGGWQLSDGHSEARPERDALFAMWDQLTAHGLDTLDCADIYTGVEQLIGDYRRARPGRRVQVHTKFVPDRDALASVDRTYVTRIIDRSLERLGGDALDLVQFHWWRYDVPRMVETAQLLDELRRAGKIRHLALTNTDTAHTKAILDAGVPLVSTQIQYSVLDRRPAGSLAALALARDLKLLGYGSVAGGFLSERWLGAAAPADALENRSLIKYRLVIEDGGGWDAFQRRLGVLHAVATRHGVQVANVAQRWVLDQPAVGAVIVGMRTPASAAGTLRTLDLALDADDHAAIAAAFAGTTGPVGEVYAAERDPQSHHAGIIRYNLNDGPAPPPASPPRAPAPPA